MKLTSVALVSALAAVAVALAVLYSFGEPFSAPDLLGFVPLTFLPAFLLCVLLYAPVLRRLRRRRSDARPAYLFPLVPVLLNLPLLLLMLALALAGRLFSGPGEVAVFSSAFFAGGLIFGIGFARLC